MLLLLFAGVGNQAPVVDGVRAHGHTTYASVYPSSVTFTAAHGGWGAMRGVTDATGNQTVTTQASGDSTAHTNADTTEE